MSGPSESDVEIPPLGLTALTWGLFMGTSSNVRYQVSAATVLLHAGLQCRMSQSAARNGRCMLFLPARSPERHSQSCWNPQGRLGTLLACLRRCRAALPGGNNACRQ